MNIRKLLIEASEGFPDKPAVIFTEQSITFSQLKETVFRLAGGLKSLGLNKGVRVAIYLPNIPEYILTYLAVYSLAGIVVPLDFMLIQEELENIISHSEAKILVTKEKKDIDLRALKQKTGLEKIVSLDQLEIESEFIHFYTLLKQNIPIEPEGEISDSDYSTVFYTSGSTGHPKGVLLNYLHLNGPVEAIRYFLPLTNQEVILSTVPLSHAAGWVFFLIMIYFKATLILQERFMPLESLKNIEKYKVSFICLVPSMYVAMLGLKEFKRFNLKSLVYVVVFGAPSSPVLLRRFHQACPKAYLLNGWGMTETSPPNMVLPLGSRRIESVGKPPPWIEIKIFDEKGNEVKPGEVGELAIRGWVVMEGYYKEPILTQQVMRNGWFYTGDLARIDADGLVYIVGRKKEMIKVAGEIVYSPEVEDALHRHPKISEVAVIGIPDRLRGEVPKAFIVLKKDKGLTVDELRYFCRRHLAHFKIPHYFEFRDSLPKTRSGKIDKVALLQ